jgi:cytochrome c peroxidase
MRRLLPALALAAATLACAAEPPAPPPAQDPARADLAALGERLFFDPRLSSDNTVSCASCHDPSRAVGVSRRPLLRNAPALWNLEARAPYFWDGRASTLEEQALGPMTDPDEMGQDAALLPAELASDLDYRERFAQCFPGEGITALGVARALAAYERTLVSRSSPYDRYLAGEVSALSDEQILGLELFEGKAECTTCHRGPELTDNGFHRVGIRGDDPGRAAVDPASGPRGGFKTPSLREVGLTAPYFHDGSVASLEEVVEHYARGGDPAADAPRDIHPLELTDHEKHALVAFMRSLSSAP